MTAEQIDNKLDYIDSIIKKQETDVEIPQDLKSLNAVAKVEYYRIMNSQGFADAVEGLTYELYGG